MKKLLLIVLSISLFSCNSKYDKANKLYERGIQLNSTSLLQEARFKIDMIQEYEDDYILGVELDKKIDSVYKIINTEKLNKINVDTLEAYQILHNLNEDETSSLLIQLESEKKEKLKLKEAKKIEDLKSLNKLKKRFDDISGITWYEQPYYTHYNNSFLTSIYIGSENSNWLRLKMSYTGDNWIFFKKAYFSFDGNTKEVFFDKYKDKESENSGGKIWEWIDVKVDNELELFLRKFAKSKNAKMRLSGKYSKTRTLTYNERKGILDVLNGYDALKTID